MAIKEPILFITIEEFKNSKYFNELLFDKVTTPDNEIWFAISVASNNIDYLSGFTISKKWPEITPTDFTDNIQTATTHYVRFLLTKDVDYLRGQGSISQGGLTYSETNPDDPYFIPPEVFNCLRKIKEYPNIKGFNLKGIEPQKNNWFNKFISNCSEDSPLNAYIPYNNIKSLDSRTKITISHPQNMLRPVVNIDTTGINTSTTIPEFKSPKETIDIKYYESNHTVNADISNKIQNEIDKKQNKSETVFIWKSSVGASGKYDGGGYLSMSNKQITSLGTPTSPSDATTKQYVDDKIPNLTDYYKKEEIDKKLDDDFGYIDRKKQDITDDNLQTTAKTIVEAINEINKKQPAPSPTPTIPKWKEVGIISGKNQFITYDFKPNKEYKLSFTWLPHDINNSVIQFLNFYILKEKTPFSVLQTFYQEKNADLKLCISNNLIAVLNYNNEKIDNCLYKLEELQE